MNTCTWPPKVPTSTPLISGDERSARCPCDAVRLQTRIPQPVIEAILAIEDRTGGYPRHHRVDQDFVTTGEFRTLASNEQNAFCLPGGKVAVFEGILPVCETEAGLAVVMSHEIGHALARHGGERMSQTKVVDGGKQAIAMVMRNQDAKRQEIVMQAYGLGSQYGE